MPTRIPELPASTVTSSNDLLPISQYTGAKRETRKITSAQLRDFININPNLRIDDLYSKISSMGNDKVSVSGDEMTGFLTLHHKPQQPYHAATKNYVDSIASDVSSGAGSTFVYLSGDSMKGYLKLFADAFDSLDAVPKRQMDTQLGLIKTNLATGFVHLSGDIMTSYLTLNGDPVNPNHAANKNYVMDAIAGLTTVVGTNYVSKSGDTMAGALNFDGNYLEKFKVKVIEKSSAFTLDSTHNGSVILVDSAAEVVVTVAQNTLPVGFNTVIIQMGNGGAKINSSGSVSIININNALLTRKKYAQMNFCVVRSNTVWISGDII